MAFESLTERLNGVFKKLRGKGKLNEADIKAAMREVRMALLEADVNYKVAKDFCAQVSERAMGQEVMESLTPAQQVVKIVNEELTNLMGGNEPKYLRLKNKGQTVLMMCGLQGNGKTTHAAKLGKYYRSQGRRPLLVACDIYRPAAIEQLKVVGEQAGVPVFTLGTEKPEIIAQKALAYAKDHGNDIVILDTAGRLQIDDQLMDELVRIKQAVEVDETLLVVDAMAGQEAVNVAKTFNEKVGISGVILTKTDGDTRGGAALSVLAVTGMPIYFQGTGEKLEDLEPFYKEHYKGYEFDEDAENVRSLQLKADANENVLKLYYKAEALMTLDKDYVAYRDGEELDLSDGEELKAGDVIQYTITLKNTGTRNLTNVTVEDTFTGAEGELVFISGDAYEIDEDTGIISLKDTLKPGETVDIRADYEVQLNDSGWRITNEVLGDATELPPAGKPHASVTITPEALKNYEIHVSADKYVKSVKGTFNKGTKSFTDLSGHWSKSYVELAAGNGWIAGYPDGSFRPDQKITRAETVTMINRVLERVPAKELRLLSRSIMLTFPDNNPGDWYYIAIQEASNSHEYQRSVYETTGDEMWTKLIDNVDWTKLEK